LTRRLSVLPVALAAATLVTAVALPSGGAAVRPLDGVALYSAGEEVDGLPLAAVLRRDDTASYVSFVYGDCVAVDDTGCAPPAEVQVWPACRRSLGLYRGQARGMTPALEPAFVRGVPAAFLDGGGRLELQTGRTTLVVFAGTRARVERIAGALRALDGSVASGQQLPPPVPGALEGEVPC